MRQYDIEKIIRTTAEYICGLQDGTVITIEQASINSCGFDSWDVGTDLLEACSEIFDRVRQAGIIMDGSISEDFIGGLPYRDKYIVRRLPLKSESLADIIVLPAYEDLKAETEKLRTELSMLLLERDELVFVICRNLETEYMLKIGGLEHQLYAKQCEAQRLKRKSELIQAALNRQKKPDFAKIDSLLDEEFAAYQEKLDEQVRQMNEALKHGSAEILSEEDTKELKSLYRKIVKVLHPDLHPNISEAERQLFENAVTAYKNGDLLSIRAIYETIGDSPVTPDDADTMQALMKTKKHLEEFIKGINKEIDGIKGRYPYTERDLLADDAKMEERKLQLRGALEQYQKLCNVYLERIAAMKG